MRIPDTLIIPLIKNLDENNLDDAIITLQNNGVKGSIDNINWPDKFPYHPLTVFNCAHNGRYLFIDFFVRCNYLRAVNYTNNSPVSEDSCIEFFVSPANDGHYWNFELNCIGTINASHRTERHNPTRLTDSELDRVIRFASCGKRPFNELEGLFAWNVTIAIPLDLIGVCFTGDPVEMAANFYKCASGTSQPHYLSWNPISSEKPDFHRPDCFGKIVLDTDRSL